MQKLTTVSEGTVREGINNCEELTTVREGINEVKSY